MTHAGKLTTSSAFQITLLPGGRGASQRRGRLLSLSKSLFITLYKLFFEIGLPYFTRCSAFFIQILYNVGISYPTISDLYCVSVYEWQLVVSLLWVEKAMYSSVFRNRESFLQKTLVYGNNQPSLSVAASLESQSVFTKAPCTSFDAALFTRGCLQPTDPRGGSSSLLQQPPVRLGLQ